MKTARAGLAALLLVTLVPSAQAVPVANSAAAKSALQASHAHALDTAANGNLKAAIREMQLALSVSKDAPRAERDRVELSIGRLHYENGDFDKAVEAYGHVAKGGPSWLEALEEEAWAQFRRGQPHDSIARLKTVTSSAFVETTTSEPFFLLGLAQLRVCDYKAVFQTIEKFKERFIGKAKAYEASTKASEKTKLKEIGESVQKLNIVEAEAIQRLYLDENGKPRRGSAPSITKGSDQLSFPDDDTDEVWMDEVDSYKVTLKGCVAPGPVVARKDAASKEITR
ncbi:MAG: hypothetical protein AAB250_14635 [Bdellovibrionota bacterium]